MDYKKIAMEKHAEWAGKIEVISRAEVNNADDLSVAYTPGVAEPCLAIKEIQTRYMSLLESTIWLLLLQMAQQFLALVTLVA